LLNEIIAYLLKIAGVAACVAFLSSLLMYRWRQRFTREYFLLPLVVGFSCVILLTIGIVYDGQLFTNTFPLLGIMEQNMPAGKTLGILLLGVTWIGIVLAGKQIQQWDGKKSFLQYQEEMGERKLDFPDILKAILTGDASLQAWEGMLPESITPLIPTSTNLDKPWHIHAIELFELIISDFKINLGSEEQFLQFNWHESENCYVIFPNNTAPLVTGIYSNNKEVIGVLCVKEEPSFGALEQFTKFVQAKSDGTACRLYVFIGNDAVLEKEQINFILPIKIRYKNELIHSLIEQFEAYRQSIINQYELVPLEIGQETTINSIYVPPSGKQLLRNTISKESKFQAIENVESYLKDWLTEDAPNNRKQIALLGEYGQGKSVLSLQIAYAIYKNNQYLSRLPIIFELRGSSPRSFRSQLEFISVWAANHNISPKVVLKLQELGRLLLIFEGFDEMDLVGDYQVRLGHFQKLWSFSSPKSKLLITGRPNFFLNDKELVNLLRTHQDVPELPYCEEIHLNMFDLSQIEQAIRYKPQVQQDQILQLLKASPPTSGFRDLMQRPTLLFIAGMIWEEEQLYEKGAFINSAFIMERFLNYSYNLVFAKNKL